MFVKGMNRLRAAYLDIDPSLEPYFITGVTDDDDAIGQTYTMGPVRDFSHVAASSGIFITAVNTIVAGGVTTFVLWSMGPWPAAIGGVALGICHFAFWIYLGWRSYQVNLTPEWTRFPSGRVVGQGQESTSPG